MASLVAQQFAVSGLAKTVRAARPRTATRAARAVVYASAEARPVWKPGTPPAAHLDGTLPGDFGFDPLGLGSDPELLKWFVQAELQHARWAMIGLLGMVTPELLTKIGMADLPNWIDAGKYEYYMSGGALFWVQMLMMNWAEVRRWQDMKNPGTMNEDPLTGANAGDPNTDVGYPAGLFDPFGYSKKSEAETAALKVKEIKNGRLAMVAIVGVFVQATVTGTGPVDNLTTHLADPGHHTIFQTMGLGM